jgi:hypothetical protein
MNQAASPSASAPAAAEALHAQLSVPATLPTLEELPNECITFAHVAHPSFPLPSASAEELCEYVLGGVDGTNETALAYGVCDTPTLSTHGVALLGARTALLIGAGGVGVGSMHSYGTDVHLRFPLLVRELGERLRPLFELLFRAPSAAPAAAMSLFSSHSIAYGTGPTRETALKLHVDDSTYTATICVLATPDLRGTQLVFHGQQALQCPRLAEMQADYARARRNGGVDVRAPEDARNHIEKLPRAGHALLHLGKHPHRTLPVQGGERYSWVLWWHQEES